MKTPRPTVATAAVALCLSLGPVLAPAARAQSLPLTNAVGKDAHLMVHGVASQTPDPGAAAFERALAQLAASGIHEDIFDLATMDMRPERAEKARAVFHHVLGLFGRVDWGELTSREVVFSEHFAVPVPEYMLICRVREGQASRHLASLRAMFDGFAEMIGDAATVDEVERETGNMVVLGIQRTPVQFAAGSVADVVILSTSTRSTAAAMRRLTSGGEGSLPREEAVEETFEQLPHATESTFYLDVDGLMGFFGQVVQLSAGQARHDPNMAALADVLATVLEEIDVVDHLAIATSSDGTTTTDTRLVRMKPDFEDSRIVQLCAKQQPWTEWYRFVPADATSFVFDAGMDVGGLMDWIAEIVGEQHPIAHHPLFAHVREILGHLSGESACVSFPQAGEAGCVLGETVVLMRLEKTEGVARWLRAHLDRCAAFAQSRGQRFEIETSGEMHTLKIAAFPWIRPVVGVRDGMLVLATSPAAVEQVARVHSGEAKDIRSSERFARLGIGKPGHYLDYYQLEHTMDGFNNLLSAAGFFLSMLPEDRKTRAPIKLGAICTKLANACRGLDLSMDVGSETLDSPSPDVVLTRRVTRYRR